MNWGSRTFQILVTLISMVCGLVCCWLMVESFSLSFENIRIPKWLLWIPAWCVWSLMIICFYSILNSLNKYLAIEHRLRKFILGVLGLFFLWFGLMLPTNAHTFFYKQVVKPTAIKELKHVDGELKELSSEEKFLQTYKYDWNTYEQSVLDVLRQLQIEIYDYRLTGRRGRAVSLIDQLENVLQVEKGTIKRIAPQKYSREEINKVCTYYCNVVGELLELKRRDYDKEIKRAYADFQEQMKNVAPLRRDIQATLDLLEDDMYAKEDVLKNARKVIGRSYAELESQFNGIYTYDENVYRSDRLVKVTKVWGDYFKGRFRNTDYTLWYWILLSLMIEMISLFIFLPRTIDEYLAAKYHYVF